MRPRRCSPSWVWSCSSWGSRVTETALRRESGDAMIAGVCAGIARRFGIDPLIPRIAFVGVTVVGGAGLALYAVLWWLLPSDDGGRRFPPPGGIKSVGVGGGGGPAVPAAALLPPRGGGPDGAGAAAPPA